MHIEQLQGNTAKAIAATITDTGMVCGYVGISTESKVADEIKRHKHFAENQFSVRGTGGISFAGKNDEIQMEYMDRTNNCDSLVWIGFDKYAKEDEIREEFSAEQADEIIACRWTNAEQHAESICDVIDMAKIVAMTVEKKEKELMAEKSR